MSNLVTPKKHVFLSYHRENAEEVSKLRDALIAAGETVWWDRDILPGEDRSAGDAPGNAGQLRGPAVPVPRRCGGPSRPSNREILDAIDIYRECKTGEIFLIPVRLNECEIPPIEIDATRTLERLQHVDLFPPASFNSGVTRLVQALRTAAGRAASASARPATARPTARRKNSAPRTATG